MEARDARRTAERTARERLGGSLIGAAGELGVALAQQHTAAAGLTAAEDQAREHVHRAQQEADAMLANAGQRVAAADEDYRRAHEAALAAGWSAAALADMGYVAPPAPRKRTRRPTARDNGSEEPDGVVEALGPEQAA